MKCPACGGDAELVSGNHYRCIYCTHEFDEGGATPQQPQQQPRAEEREEGADIFEQNANGVLEIACAVKGGYSLGSGLLIDDSGLAVTNAHVVVCDGVPSKDIVVKIAGQKVRASIVAIGKGVDLALLQLASVPRKAKTLSFADFQKVRIGEKVYVIGNSLGEGTCMTSGIVSDKCRKVGGDMLMMTDCAVNCGNSGGPIFNHKGEAIGVIVSGRIKEDGTDAQGMNYAIPSFTVEEFLAQSAGAVRSMGRRR